MSGNLDSFTNHSFLSTICILIKYAAEGGCARVSRKFLTYEFALQVDKIGPNMQWRNALCNNSMKVETEAR